MVLNWHHSRLDLYWIQSGVNLTPEFLQCIFDLTSFSWNGGITLQWYQPNVIKKQIIKPMNMSNDTGEGKKDNGTFELFN